MTKKDITKALAAKTGMTQVEAKEYLEAAFEAIIEALETHDKIEIRNFGVFSVKTRAPRKARNPRTGETVMVPEKKVVAFKPGRKMEERVH